MQVYLVKFRGAVLKIEMTGFLRGVFRLRLRLCGTWSFLLKMLALILGACCILIAAELENITGLAFAVNVAAHPDNSSYTY